MANEDGGARMQVNLGLITTDASLNNRTINNGQHVFIRTLG